MIKKIFIYLIVVAILLTFVACGNDSVTTETTSGSNTTPLSANVTFESKAFIVVPDSFEIYNSADVGALVKALDSLDYSTQLCKCMPIATITVHGAGEYYLKGSIDLTSFHSVCKYVDGVYMQADISDAVMDILKEYLPVSSSENAESLNASMSATIFVNDKVGTADAMNIYEVNGTNVRRFYNQICDLIYSSDEMVKTMDYAMISFDNGESYFLIDTQDSDGSIYVESNFGAIGQAKIDANVFQQFKDIVKDATAFDWTPEFGDYFNNDLGVITIGENELTYYTYSGYQFTCKYTVQANIMICFDPDLEGEVYLRIQDDSLEYLKDSSSEIEGIDAEDGALFIFAGN